ncbi:Zinc finger protein CONSTANS-LIKE 1 [Dendrobium catenatum]|uniref:Zinc finger protein CONSTANS-LIKE 1 n=1 Tax=Dendrobium catenatum TaxID=906689 RepID=A0A2I0X9T7_9ASPA|nr:Zinc finger protein CONSTANS-LIKE 1 [Dendrobium catenatum]
MAPIHPMDQLNPMICNPSFTSYSPNSVVSQLPLDHVGLPEYMGMEPSAMQLCSFMDANGGIGGELYAEGMGMPICVADDEVGIYASVGMPMTPMEAAEAYGLGGIYTYEAMSGVYSPRNLQVLRDSTKIAPLQGTFDITTMDDSNHKVGRASPEERKKKVDRYVSKKKARNFSKTIKYACRKTLADSRPRVRGRFAKNDEFSEVVQRPSSANGGYDDEATSSRNDEDMTLDSSEILSYITGVNSFGFNFPVESLI